MVCTRLRRWLSRVFGPDGAAFGAEIQTIAKKYAYQAKFKDFTAHNLRHSFAENLVDAGTHLDQIAVLLSHESLDTTRICAQPSERDLERSLQREAGKIIRDDG